MKNKRVVIILKSFMATYVLHTYENRINGFFEGNFIQNVKLTRTIINNAIYYYSIERQDINILYDPCTQYLIVTLITIDAKFFNFTVILHRIGYPALYEYYIDITGWTSEIFYFIDGEKIDSKSYKISLAKYLLKNEK